MPDAENKEELIDFLLKNMRRIRDDSKDLQEQRKMALKFYRSDPEIVSIAEKRSKATTTDLMDIVEWAKPSLLEIFAGGDEVCSLQPGGEEDAKAVEKQNILVNHQLRIKNKWFLVLHDWIDDALKLKIGWIKYQWYREVQTFIKTYDSLTEEEYRAKIAEKNLAVLAEEKIPITEPTFDEFGQMLAPGVYEHNLTVRYKIEDEYPLIEAVPAEDIGFPINCRDVEDAQFMWHRNAMPKWKFKKLYGKAALGDAERSKDALEDIDNEVRRERVVDLGSSFFWNEKKEEFIVYECYYRDPDTGDPKIAEVCFDKLLKRVDEREAVRDNDYRKPPFHGITPIKRAHKVAGFSFYDLVKELQMIRTALLRQILDNVYFANNRRYFGDVDRMNIDAYLNNNVPGAIIPTEGDPRTVVMPEEKAPIPPEIWQFWEMLNVEKDYHSGVPRSFQGVNPNVLNKTWRGQNEQVSQASQRIAMMARLIAEMAIGPLVSDIVDLNIRFLKKKTAVRYLNGFVDIAPDNIIGKYDCIVNVGIGAGDKQQTIMFMQQLLGLYVQVKAAGGGALVTPTNVYNAMRELIKAMGLRNVGDFVTDPKFGEAVGMLLQALQQNGVLMQDPQIGQMAYSIALQLGLIQPPKPGQEKAAEAGPAGTFPGQQPPAIPFQPAQPMNPTMPPGGGYFG